MYAFVSCHSCVCILLYNVTCTKNKIFSLHELEAAKSVKVSVRSGYIDNQGVRSTNTTLLILLLEHFMCVNYCYN